jgi:hypothetical protein
MNAASVVVAALKNLRSVLVGAGQRGNEYSIDGI